MEHFARAAFLARLDLRDVVGVTLTACLVVGAIVLVIVLARAPGAIARDRGHPSAEAINICGWIGLLVWPAWWVALVWAYTGPDRSRTTKPAQHPKYERAFDPVPASFQPLRPIDTEIEIALGNSTYAPADSAPQDAAPGMFEIVGVDRGTKMDTTWRVRADNAANAKVKAELEGIVVTSIKRV